jgi:homoserine dehydrogenase
LRFDRSARERRRRASDRRRCGSVANGRSIDRCRYEKPLVIQGAGAGVGTTAAGVLSDMVELAFTA